MAERMFKNATILREVQRCILRMEFCSKLPCKFYPLFEDAAKIHNLVYTNN